MDEKLASYRKDCEGIEGPVGRENEMNRKFYKEIGRKQFTPLVSLESEGCDEGKL